MGTVRKTAWSQFLTATKDNSATPALLKAISFFINQEKLSLEKTAVDLGCGAGGDTIALIKNGWKGLSILMAMSKLGKYKTRS